MTSRYSPNAPTREQVDGLDGPAVLEFGTNWCGHCRAAQPVIDKALQQKPEVRHMAIEDGKGRRLGRSYGVKLWPTLIFLKDGEEAARLVRPRDVTEVADAMAAITS